MSSDFERMSVDASVLGWTLNEFPKSFERDGKTWTREHLTTAEDGEIQCGEYQSGDEWLIVVNE